jgi:hypothetical protein
VTVGLAIVATLVVVIRAELHIEAPSPLLVGVVVLGIVIPKLQMVVTATLGALIVLALLPFGMVYALFDRGAYLIEAFAKVTSLINGVSLPAWACAPRKVTRTAPAPAAAPAPAGASDVDDDAYAKQQAFLAASAPPSDFSPPKFEEPVYDGALVGMAERRPTGATDALDTDIRPRGRHAKADPERAAELAAVPDEELMYGGLSYGELSREPLISG